MALDALGEAELSYSPTHMTLRSYSDRLPELLADSNDATHTRVMVWSSVFFINVIWFIETFTTIIFHRKHKNKRGGRIPLGPVSQF